MFLGVDFDNTIVSYDALFYRLARQRDVIPPGLTASKGVIRDYLRAQGQEDIWTELQGLAYGAEIQHAAAFPGALAFFRACKAAGVAVAIVSHKTLRPFAGADQDLHQSAHGWLHRQGFYEPGGIGLDRRDVYFELTKQDKLRRIESLGCTHFIDDLPEFLSEPGFPSSVTRWLFDPHNEHPGEVRFSKLSSWPEAESQLLGLVST